MRDTITVDIHKGTRIRARWFRADLVGLAGLQAKMGLTPVEFTGTVRHVRVDHPTAPTVTWLFVEPDAPDEHAKPCATCGVLEIRVDPKHVVGVLGVTE